ncbi:methyltransferase domain-containing protein [Corynebacterium choanae]|nr:class I SAM-dependent methyltransferase [Corynebacterium choanae]
MHHPTTPEANIPAERRPGHWVLAELGKKVLRPGGKELTETLIAALPLRGADVVEFAPGMGMTAGLLLAQQPATYTGVDRDETAVKTVTAAAAGAIPVTVKQASADATGLAAESADVVIGEAMLTMNNDKQKQAIMQEAFRVLRPGGRYAIHELSMVPDSVDDSVKTQLTKSLAQAIRVNARPLTHAEWKHLAESVGFHVVGEYSKPMALLEPRRMIADEGLRGMATIAKNLLTKPALRRRVLTMRSTFRTHRDHLGAIGLVLEKPATT